MSVMLAVTAYSGSPEFIDVTCFSLVARAVVRAKDIVIPAGFGIQRSLTSKASRLKRTTPNTMGNPPALPGRQ